MCLFLLICMPQVHSQKIWETGYVILNTGDTLSGMVCDRKATATGTKLYSKIRFRGDEGVREKFTAYDIKGYAVGNSLYESMWYHESMAFFIMSYTSRRGVGKKIFLQVVRRGYLTCYYKEYVDGDSGYVDGFELFKRPGDAYFMRATQGIFGLKKKRLTEYFSDCPSLVKKINTGQITCPVEVVDYYNSRCPKSGIEI